MFAQLWGWSSADMEEHVMIFLSARAMDDLTSSGARDHLSKPKTPKQWLSFLCEKYKDKKSGCKSTLGCFQKMAILSSSLCTSDKRISLKHDQIQFFSGHIYSDSSDRFVKNGNCFFLRPLLLSPTHPPSLPTVGMNISNNTSWYDIICFGSEIWIHFECLTRFASYLCLL